MYIYIYIHTYIHTYIHIRIHTYIHIRMSDCLPACLRYQATCLSRRLHVCTSLSGMHYMCIYDACAQVCVRALAYTSHVDGKWERGAQGWVGAPWVCHKMLSRDRVDENPDSRIAPTWSGHLAALHQYRMQVFAAGVVVTKALVESGANWFWLLAADCCPARL